MYIVVKGMVEIVSDLPLNKDAENGTGRPGLYKSPHESPLWYQTAYWTVNVRESIASHHRR